MTQVIKRIIIDIIAIGTLNVKNQYFIVRANAKRGKTLVKSSTVMITSPNLLILFSPIELISINSIVRGSNQNQYNFKQNKTIFTDIMNIVLIL